MTRDSGQAVVVGGSFAGLAAAASLCARGLSVTLVESLPAPADSLRGELLHPPGVRALATFGLEAPLRADGADEVRGFSAWRSPDAAPAKLDYPSGVGLGLEHRNILEALRAALAQRPNLVHRPGSKVEGLLREAGRVKGVQLASGEKIEADVVVAADGRHSRLRRLLEIPTRTTLLSYTAGLGLEKAELPDGPRGHVFLGGPGPVLAYPFGGGRVRVNVDVPLGAPKGQAALAAYIAAEHLPWVPEPLRSSIRAGLEKTKLQVAANHAIVTSAVAAPGIALVGDAGGCSHPLTATGMTCAMHDVTTLGACIAQYGLRDDALLAYQRRRYRYVRARETFAAALYQAFQGATPGARALREGVFRYWQEPRSRQASMAILSGDESRVTAFVGEYLRAVAAGGKETLTSGGLNGARNLGALLHTASGCLELALDKAASTVRSEHARALPDFTVPQPLERWTGRLPFLSRRPAPSARDAGEA